MYTILVKYETGDSFGSEQVEDTFGLFSSVQDAQKACEKILHHYTFATDNNISKDKVQYFSWYHNPDDDDWYGWRYSLSVGEQIVQAAWVGYFEKLISLHVVLYDDEEKLSFYI